MTTLTGTRQNANGQATRHMPQRHRHRNTPLALAGLLVVAACAALFATGWAHTGHGSPVLALTHSVTAGTLITAADVRVIRVSADGRVNLIPASQEIAVVGRTAAVALPAGSLLATGEIGAAALAPGQAVLGVAVKPGQYPPDLSAGQVVAVLATPAASAGSSSGSGANGAALPVGRAVVLSVVQSSSSGTTVAELQMSQDVLPQVAAAAATGQISLAAMPQGR